MTLPRSRKAWVVVCLHSQDPVHVVEKGKKRVPFYGNRTLCEKRNKWVGGSACKGRYEVREMRVRDIRAHENLLNGD